MLNHIEKTGDDEYTIIVVGIVNLNRADCGIAITGDRNPTITGSSNAGPTNPWPDTAHFDAPAAADIPLHATAAHLRKNKSTRKKFPFGGIFY